MASNTDRGRAASWTHLLALLRCLPWAILAGASYLLLHSVAMRPEVIVTAPSQLWATLPGLVVGWAADALQFVVPGLCLFGAFLLRGGRLLAPEPEPQWAGNAMTRLEFEKLTSGGLRLSRRPHVARVRIALAPERESIADRLVA